MTQTKAPGEKKHGVTYITAEDSGFLFVIRLTSGGVEADILSRDTSFRESSELELCPSAADSFEHEDGAEFLLLILLQEVEEEEEEERGALS